MSQTPYTPQPGYTLPPSQPDNSGLKTAILFGAVIALIAANIYLYVQIDNLKQQLVKVQDSLIGEVGRVRETGNVTSAAAKKNIEDLQTKLAQAGRMPTRPPVKPRLTPPNGPKISLANWPSNREPRRWRWRARSARWRRPPPRRLAGFLRCVEREDRSRFEQG